jgi:hypothetical protein
MVTPATGFVEGCVGAVVYTYKYFKRRGKKKELKFGGEPTTRYIPGTTTPWAGKWRVGRFKEIMEGASSLARLSVARLFKVVKQ